MKIPSKKILITIIVVLLLIALGVVSILLHSKIHLFGEKKTSEVNVEFRDFDEKSIEQMKDGRLNICLITKGYDSAYWDSLIRGAVECAEENDINLILAGVKNEGFSEKYADLMEEAIRLEPDVIIIAPVDTARINALVDEINEKKIPLIFVDTILNGQKFGACYMTDNIEAGRMVAEEMLRKLKDVGYKESDSISVGIDIGSTQSQTIIERLAGFNEYWSDNAPKKWKVADSIKCNNGSADVAYEQCKSFFEENDDLAGLIGLNNGSTVGLSKGLLEVGRKDVVLIGFDYSDEIANLIEQGEYPVATMVQRQYNMGRGSINTAMDICNGIEPVFKFFNTGISKVDHSNYNSSYIIDFVLEQ